MYVWVCRQPNTKIHQGRVGTFPTKTGENVLDNQHTLPNGRSPKFSKSFEFDECHVSCSEKTLCKSIRLQVCLKTCQENFVLLEPNKRPQKKISELSHVYDIEIITLFESQPYICMYRFSKDFMLPYLSKFIRMQHAPGSDIVQIQNSVRKVVAMKQ